MAFNDEHPVDIKEKAPCILVNIAFRNSAKEFIISNHEALKKLLLNYIINRNVKLQIALVFCVSNSKYGLA